jgi:hypothetical protein
MSSSDAEDRIPSKSEGGYIDSNWEDGVL